MRRSYPEIHSCPTVQLLWDVIQQDEMKSGCTVNGEDYPSAVNYWIPFDGNLGISDAPWRMDFGGQLYEFEGTHGSICAPSDQVQIIFSNVEKNTPIVIYE